MTGPTGMPGPTVRRTGGVHSAPFRRLSHVWLLSSCGDGIRMLALPLYVAVQSRDPLATAAVAASEALPWLLCGLPAGALVDRLPARGVLIAAQLVRAVVTMALVVALAAGVDSIGLLCAIAFVLTTAETFADPASQVAMVQLAGRDDLDAANARYYTVNTIALHFVGPLAGSVIFAVGPVWTFGAVGTAFLLAALMSTRLPKAPAGDNGGVRLTAGLAEGARLLWGHPGLRTLLFMVMIGSIATAGFTTLLPLYAVGELALGPHVIGLLVMAFGAAALTGTWLAPRLAGLLSDGPVMVSGMAVAGVGFVLTGLFRSVAALASGVVLAGLGIGLWNVLSAARRQRLTPAGSTGRISGVYRMAAWGLTPLGSALAGVAAAATSLRSPLLTAGAVMMLTAALLSVPVVRSGERKIVGPLETAPGR